MPKTRGVHSGGIKPLNTPRVVYVRTDSTGIPVAVQVPSAVASPRGRRGVHGQAGSPSLAGRGLEGGLVRRRARPSAELTQKTRELRRNATPAENLLWKHLRKTQVPKYKFTRQYPVGPYVVDFCCRSSRLIIELDGGHHAGQKELDMDRQQYLEAEGYQVVRFWNSEVFENLEGVLFRIVEVLEVTDVRGARGRGGRRDGGRARDPHPNPLPFRERGEADSLAPGVRGALARGLACASRAGSSAGHARVRERGLAGSLLSDGRWVEVGKVEDLWKVNDEWWRGPEEEIARLYYTLRLENGQQLTVYLDLIANNWFRQAG